MSQHPDPAAVSGDAAAAALTDDETPLIALSAKDFTVGLDVFVYATGNWRSGQVRKIGRVRVKIEHLISRTAAASRLGDFHPTEVVPAAGLQVRTAVEVAPGDVLRDGRRITDVQTAPGGPWGSPRTKVLTMHNGTTVRLHHGRSLLVRTPERARATKGGLCEWFARCDRPAAMLALHPTLGGVPACAPCARSHGLHGDLLNTVNLTQAIP